MENQFLRSESPPEGQAKYWNNIPPTAVSEFSESMARVALQGLTCEKKTKSILVKVANLYSK